MRNNTGYTTMVLDYAANNSYNRASTTASTPRANITKSDNLIKIEIEMPGFSRSDIKIEVKGSTLSVTAQKDTSKVEQNNTVLAHEFNSTMLTRTWTVPKTVNVDRIDAEYEAGILMMTLPYHPDAAPESRLIEIR